jgi:hypothetical protein
MKEDPQLGCWKLLQVPSGVRKSAAKPEHAASSSCRLCRVRTGQSSKIEVLRSSTRSRPYSTCCRVSINLDKINGSTRHLVSPYTDAELLVILCTCI